MGAGWGFQHTVYFFSGSNAALPNLIEIITPPACFLIGWSDKYFSNFLACIDGGYPDKEEPTRVSEALFLSACVLIRQMSVVILVWLDLYDVDEKAEADASCPNHVVQSVSKSLSQYIFLIFEMLTTSCKQGLNRACMIPGWLTYFCIHILSILKTNYASYHVKGGCATKI